ncbi:MAG: zf-HC2 domain-containing protein [Burkholderiales bacterium]|nr:zf-HC2 domain-containing protein [Burkholderiales bacterium]
MTLLKRTCREVAAILIAREDRHLGLADRLALRLHMAVCDACPTFERQILTMRNSMRQWRNYAGSIDSGVGETAPK